MRIAIVGAHGTGKSKICERVFQHITSIPNNKVKLAINYQDILSLDFAFIPEQFREVVKDIPNFAKQTEEITMATCAKQLYLENLYTAQGKNILCDRSVLDTFVYYDYFNRLSSSVKKGDFLRSQSKLYCLAYRFAKNHTIKNYSKIYLIAPSDREIEDDGFRMTDKAQQMEIHELFSKQYFTFDNVEIIPQEDAHQEAFIKKVASKFVL